MWIEILRREVAAKGPRQVAKELGISRAAVDLALRGQYRASTRRIEQRVAAIYGSGGRVDCRVLGEVSPARCAETWRKARLIGMKAGNPETLRLYKACLTCSKRKV